jgi:hypothetical protein
MKRLFAVLACLALASPAFAMKPRRIPQQPATPAAPATVTISGNPLTIVVGDDTSMQVYNSAVSAGGQFFPPDCTAGETADSGIFVATGGVVYGPDFNNHPCGSASNTYTPLAPVSLSAVTGSGSASDPFTVIVVANVGTVMQVTDTITYVNGSPTATISLSFGAIPPPTTPTGAGITFSAFIGADLYLASNDSGFPFATPPTAAGSHGASGSCVLLQYTISFLGTTPATGYSANGYSQVWDEISAGNLSNTFASSCLDDGAALQWNEALAGTPVTISTGVSFTGQAVPAGATVPALSVTGLVVLVALLALVGFVLAKKN